MNLSIDRELKRDSVEFVSALGYTISEYVTAFLEVQLIKAGKRQPRKPVVEPVPELLIKKKA